MRRSVAIGLTWGALVTAAAGVHAGAASEGAGARWKHIKTALFFTGPDVQALLATPEQRRATLAYFAPPRLSKVHIEGSHRGSHAGGTLREIVKETVDLVD